jgi:hypothetical protein
MEELNANGYDTDKSINGYLGIYHEKFQPLANREINLLEIGVHKGASLLMWRDYFKSGVIAGLDYEPVTVDDNTGRIHIYRGFQQDPAILDKIRIETAREGFDIIIDDASHLAELTSYTFWHLFDNHLKPGGIYVLEDWGVGYWNKWLDGKKYYLKLPRDSKKYKANSINTMLAAVYKISTEYTTSGVLSNILRKACELVTILTLKKKFKSHEYGLVGVVKQLIDELGMANITLPDRGTVNNWRDSKFSSIDIFPNLVFIRKKETAFFKTI